MLSESCGVNLERIGDLAYLEDIVEAADLGGHLRCGRIHLFDGGSEYYIRFRLLKHLAVTCEVTRVLGQVLAGAKLQGVDKDGANDEFGIGSSLLDERDVAAVKEAHRGHKPDPRTRTMLINERLANSLEFPERRNNLHSVGVRRALSGEKSATRTERARAPDRCASNHSSSISKIDY